MFRWLLLFPLVLSAAPTYFSIGAGAYDLLRDKWRTWQFDAEVKFGLKPLNRYLTLQPVVGGFVNAHGGGYVLGGINFDLLFFDQHVLISPGFAAGYYWKGSWKDLGYPLEFRSGIELAWQFSDWRRLGVHFYHLSNASLGKKNPGEESLVFYYDIPIKKGFPFNN